VSNHSGIKELWRMPRTEATVKSLGPSTKVPSGPASLCMFLVRKPPSFSQDANWLSVFELTIPLLTRSRFPE